LGSKIDRSTKSNKLWGKIIPLWGSINRKTHALLQTVVGGGIVNCLGTSKETRGRTRLGRHLWARPRKLLKNVQGWESKGNPRINAELKPDEAKLIKRLVDRDSITPVGNKP